MLDVFVLNRRVLMRALSKKKVCKIWLRIEQEKPKKPISKVSVRYFSVRPSLPPISVPLGRGIAPMGGVSVIYQNVRHGLEGANRGLEF